MTGLTGFTPGRSGGGGARPSSVLSMSGSRGRNSAFVGTETHQCFGHFSGRVRVDDGTWIGFDGLTGWAEECRQRW
ncbi:DUF2804 family protein [Actinomadura sp. B10D3]|uniref:DUF2804 family protein n=1 Tax=Actinomadura sp. B10D3 TaxID=3153557 RepID=UPI00325F10E9